ncbi:MAG: type I restriction-modification system subunit M [Clostridia bacterium]|nr:type I restriction-modification system subunit M [Clostridia bacterium]
MNKQQLASKIWESANKMRSKIEANEYKDYILGFIFYKFLSEKETDTLLKDGWSKEDFKKYLTEDDDETVKYCQKNLGYFISYNNLFSTWIEKGMDFAVGDVSEALSAFDRLINDSHKKVFNKIFDTLQTGLSKLGDTSGAQTKAIRELLNLIKVIPMDDRQDYDVLGFIYEYLISNFAANAGKKAGEFYTPHEVSMVMSEIVANHLKDREKIEIYDPTSGSGSLLINIGKCVSKYVSNKDNIKYYAQELKENTYNLTRMNLVMRGIIPDNIVTRNGDTLEDDWPYFDDSDPSRTYNPLYVDAVVSNPPYSQNWDPTNKEGDARYARYGLAPKAKADYAFLLHDLYHIKPDGIMTIVLPHGVLFRGGEEEKIRKALIENNNIDAIIGLPANIFYGTGIPTIIMVLRQKRPNTDVLIVDASKGFIKVGKNNKLQASDIKKIVDTVVKRETTPKYSKVVSKEEIRANEYNLNIPRYVDSSEEQESWDIYASMFGGIPNEEIDKLNCYWSAFPELKKELFKSVNSAYSALAVEDTKQTIENNSNVKDFNNQFVSAFSDFDKYLKSELISNMEKINVSKEENDIANNIFERLANIPLIDKYKAYQLLDNGWQKIAIDLEIIQTEGFESTKKVDPNMVVKKKDGKDEEVQDGYIGHVIPFELIQSTILEEEATSLANKNNELTEITNSYAEILENISEDDKEAYSSLFNDDNTAFVNSEVSKMAKTLNKTKAIYGEDTVEYQIKKVATLIEKEKSLKKEIKIENEKLLAKTKQAIETLTDEQVLELLKEKWITPIISSLNELPNEIVKELVSKISNLANKYSLTLVELESQIKESENSLSTLIDELEGNEYDMKGLEELKTLLKGE